MPKFRVAMIDYDYESLDAIAKPIEDAGGEFVARNCRTLGQAIEFAQGAQGVIIQYLGPASDRMFTEVEGLKVVARMGIGLDPIDVESATRHGVCVVHVPSYCEDEVSDQVMALLLSCARKTVFFRDHVKDGKWDFNEGRPIRRLRGRTLGLVGFGKIPRALVPKAKAFGLDVVTYDPFVTREAAEAEGVRSVELDALLAESDFVSIHCPLVDATREMFNSETFARMKPTAILINTSRGPIVNEADLAEALKTGRIAAAGLDVMVKEPPDADNPLPGLDNVVLSPHIGFYSEESLVDLQTKAGLYTAQVLRGERPAGLANPDVLERVGLS